MPKKQQTLTPAQVIVGLKSAPNELSVRSFAENNKNQISALLIEHNPTVTTPEGIVAIFKERNCHLTLTVGQLISNNLAKYKETHKVRPLTAAAH